MRLYITVLVLILSFQFWTKADDIRDFEIEGMSVGDSALDYFSKKRIRTEKKYRIKYPKSDKFSAITFTNNPKFQQYDSIQINVKKNDKKYIIQSISGIIYYGNNIDKCKKQIKIISNEFNKIFNDVSTSNKTKKHELDKTGESLIHQIVYDMDSGDEARIECYDWSKKMFKKYSLEDQLVVSILNEEFSYFMANEAY